MTDLRRALEDYKLISADLSCGSSCCPHSRDKGGQMVNGPCRCYPHDHPLGRYVMVAARLARAVKDSLDSNQG